MINQRHLLNVLGVRSYSDANADWDHYLVIAQLRCCIAQMNNQNMPKARLKYNQKRLGINEVKQEYANKLVNQIQEADEKNTLNWSVLQQIVINTADEVIGKEEWIVRSGRFTVECTEATKNKNEAYSEMVQRHKTRGAEEWYKKREK